MKHGPVRTVASANPTLMLLDGGVCEGGRWPLCVALEIRVYYAAGTAELLRVRLEPCDAPGRVAIKSHDPGGEPDGVAVVRWQDLPGTLLHARCLAVLAVHWFGSVEMTPRIVGDPLWTFLSADFQIFAAESQTLRFQLHSAGDANAALHCRADNDPAWQCRTARLTRADADPLRALLHHGMDHIRPKVLRRPLAVSPPPGAIEQEARPADHGPAGLSERV